MPNAVITVAGSTEPIALDFSGPNQTFELKSDLVRNVAGHEPDPLLLDLLEVAAAVFMADSAVTRGGSTRARMGEAWRRSFDVTMSVRDPSLWQKPEVKNALIRSLQFLTEDRWNFTFDKLDIVKPRQGFLELTPDGPSFQADEIILFSGGLDSFAGALEALATTNKKVCLVTHRSAQKTFKRQVDLGKYLSARFPGRVRHIHVLARRVGGEQAKETTHRSRSFLFAALGQVFAQVFRAPLLSFYENGVISHNLPLSSQIVGTMATRTTHPLGLEYLRQLMAELGGFNATIENRYEWKTKTDVVRRIEENGAKDQIPRAVSCTSVRVQNSLHTHCGSCSQCFDRRFAMLAAHLEDFDKSEIYKTDVLTGERSGQSSRVMAVEWTNHARSLASMSFDDFRQKFGSEVAKVARGFPNLDPADAFTRIYEMHRRHGQAVVNGLDRAIVSCSRSLADGSLDPTSLLRLVNSSGSAEITNIPQMSALSPAVAAAETQRGPDEEAFDPAGPLAAEFKREENRYVVHVKGLTTLTGQIAKAPHGLLTTFVEDRDANLRAPDYRYSQQLKLPDGEESPSKAQIRSWVRRCRKALRDDYEIVVGAPLSDHLLIQTKQGKGYRLDPDLQLLESDK